MRKNAKEKSEFGDFQTPDELALKATSLLIKRGIKPQSVIEPTCGKGSFLIAAKKTYPKIKKMVGFDINTAYLQDANTRITVERIGGKITLIAGDFFAMNWTEVLESLPEPILILGNPPWVTSAELAILQSKNLPEKSNFHGRRGYEAISGKSNFDISEWMILQNLDWLRNRKGVMAMLCKTSVARKVLFHAWKHGYPIYSANLFLIDTRKYFGASVDACFLVIEMSGETAAYDCPVYDSMEAVNPSYIIGFIDGLVVANIKLYEKWKHLRGADAAYTWRSGIKHDCAKVMEIERAGFDFLNGNGVVVSLEDTYIFPMLKSSDIANGNVRIGRKLMLVTQRHVGDDTHNIRLNATRTWEYLKKNAEAFKRRASSIYRYRPPFSIFGVGDYSFSPWKVAVSGFYKKLDFKVIGSVEDKPVVFDDTIYFLPCWSREEAHFIADLMNSIPAKEFYTSMIFWSDKRPITIEILKRLDIHALSLALGEELKYLNFARRRRDNEMEMTYGQMSLGIAEKKRRYRKTPIPA